MTVLLAMAAALTLSPLPLPRWWQSPVDAALLSLGYNPHPVTLQLPPQKPLSAMAELGKALFYDQALSGSGRLSCASCHSPSHDYGPIGTAAVATGGPALQQQGFRAVPSLKYLYRQALFSIGPETAGDKDQLPPVAIQAQQATAHPHQRKRADNTAQSASALVPMGGLFWDSRADTLQQQASIPLFNPVEMAAPSYAAVNAVLQKHYQQAFSSLFGASIFRHPREAVAEAMFAIARYQIEDSSFHPFSSRYDAWLEGKARLTAAQIRGYLAFNNPKQGNCAACHLDKPSKDGLPPLFTDQQYEALGVPRNQAIAANHNPHWHDLGLCGPFRHDMRQLTQYCGMFITPSLRNSARRPVYFHNGVFTTLSQVLDWYVNRNRQPGRFYQHNADGSVRLYDDLPRQFIANVDVTDAPFNRHPGEPPALSKAQQRDILAFLGALSDGYQPHH